MAVLLFFASVLNLYVSVYVSFLRSNFDSPPVELYSWYAGVSNLSSYLGRHVEFKSNSSVGVARIFSVISPSLFARCDKRLCLRASQSIHKPRCCRSVCSMHIAMLLIIWGVAVNPGPNFNSKFINFGLRNSQSVVRKAALVHDIIADYKFDFLA